MNIHITATKEQLTIWLKKAEDSASRAVTTQKNPRIQEVHKTELAEIRQAIREIEQGGIQTNLDEANRKPK